MTLISHYPQTSSPIIPKQCIIFQAATILQFFLMLQHTIFYVVMHMYFRQAVHHIYVEYMLSCAGERICH